MKIAINGFGRIGRMVLRSFIEQKVEGIQIVAINDLGSLEDNAHLFKYDSIHGRFKGQVITADNSLDVGLGPITVLAEPNPENLPWRKMGVDIVLECSGHFTKRNAAMKHITAGAKRVLVSAPCDGADITVVYGINHEKINNSHLIISNASCTTNCLAPIASVLNKSLGIECGFMTTIHAYTGDQRLVDTLHNDQRRARAAAMSMIPSTTGAAKAVGLVLPELKGKLDGTSIRVPVANVSVVDLKVMVARDTTIDEVNHFMQEASKNELHNILDYVTEKLVSVDFNHSPFSSSFDATQTQVVSNRLVRVVSWYDNEWGFSNRMVDVTRCLAK
ncbi:MAG: type I glyceraldehyde-3-phosphate dehydrogenase [Proteobacteria bacterium]|nr:type I glyceraldehyde-3-phosphate dehydrogenase [Pseudomonadota bacterium]